MKNILPILLISVFSPSGLAASCPDPLEPMLDCRDGTFLCVSDAEKVVDQVFEFFAPMANLNGLDLGLVDQNAVGCTLNARFSEQRSVSLLMNLYPKGLTLRGYPVRFTVMETPVPASLRTR